MSKKGFSSAFDSLFMDDDFTVETKVVEEKKEKVATPTKTKVGGSKKSAASRKFTSGLESLLSEAFEEEFKDQVKGKKVKKEKKPSNLGGLDTLIKSTIDIKLLRKSNKATRRLTILIENEKIDQLKDIAKLKKTYLKYIIRDIVSDYLAKER